MDKETQKRINELKYRVMQTHGGMEKEKPTNRARLKKEIARILTKENQK